MTDFMDQHMMDEAFDADTALGGFGEDRLAVKMDNIGQCAEIRNALVADRSPRIEAGQLHGMRQAYGFQRFRIGIFLDPQHDIAHLLAKGEWQAFERLARHRFHRIGAGRRGHKAFVEPHIEADKALKPAWEDRKDDKHGRTIER